MGADMSRRLIDAALTRVRLTLASRSEFDRAIAATSCEYGFQLRPELGLSATEPKLPDRAPADTKNRSNSAASRTTCRIESFSKRKHR